MTKQNTLCHRLLMDSFEEKKAKNPSYSLRAFSRDLGISVTAISEVMNRKRNLSKKNIEAMAEKLSLTPFQKESLIHEKRKRPDVDVSWILLEEDRFKLISHWYYLAILNLSQTENNHHDISRISKRLGISETVTEGAIDRLTRLRLLEIKDGKLFRTTQPLTTSHDVPSRAVKNFHREMIELSKRSIDEVEILERDISGIVTPMSVSQLPEAKAILMECKNKISKLSEGKKCEEVYSLSIQLFPLTKSEHGGN